MIIPLRWHLWCLPLATVLLGTGVVYAGLHGAGLTFLIVAATGLVVAGLSTSTLVWYAYFKFLPLVNAYYQIRRVLKARLPAGTVGRFTLYDGTVYLVYRPRFSHGVCLWFVRERDILPIKKFAYVDAAVFWLRPYTGQVTPGRDKVLVQRNKINGRWYYAFFMGKPSRKQWRRYRQMSPAELAKHLKRILQAARDMNGCRHAGWKTKIPAS